MKLPEHQRTEYRNNILFQVIFQARFPRIMKISNEQPVNFQDQIRKKGFPETKIKKAGDIPAAFPIPEPIRKAVSGLGDDEYMFFSEDVDVANYPDKRFCRSAVYWIQKLR